MIVLSPENFYVVVEARNTLAKDVGGTSDPYVKFMFNNINYRTKYKNKTLSPVWNESFVLDVEDKQSSIYICVMDFDFGRQDDFMGAITFNIETSNEVEKDEWIKLGPKVKEGKETKLKKKDKDRGEIRIRHHFHSYAPIISALQSPDESFVQALLSVPLSDKCIHSLVECFIAQGRALPLLFRMIDAEVAKTDSPAQLFRLDSVTTKFLVAYINIEGSMWLKLCFGSYVATVAKSHASLEVDTSRLSEGEHINVNRVNLQARAREFLEAILRIGDTCPNGVREVARRIASTVLRKFPGNELKAVGGIFFLRVVCPSLVTPHLYLQEPPSPETQRGLLLLTKIIQNVANGIPFGAKEQFMVPFNDLVNEYMPKMTTFLMDLSSPVLESAAPITPERATAHVILRAYDDILDHYARVVDKIIPTPSSYYNFDELRRSAIGMASLIKKQREYESRAMQLNQ